MTGKLGIAAVALVVAIAIAAGLIVSGSPARQRMLRADETRVSDVQRISSHIQRYYSETGRLPASLETLVDGRIASGIPRDPETDADYEYRTTGDATFDLCADFALESEAVDPRQEFWVHGAGRECYSLDFSEMPLYEQLLR